MTGDDRYQWKDVQRAGSALLPRWVEVLLVVALAGVLAWLVHVHRA